MINQLYNEYRVTQLPETGLKAGDKYYLLLPNNRFTTYIVGDNLEFYEMMDNNPAPQSGSELFSPETDTDLFE